MTIPADRPWMTALEMQFSALAEAQRALDRLNRGGPLAGDYRTPVINLIRALKHAEAYAWSGDTAMAVQLAARTLPPDTRFEPHWLGSAGWWWFEQPPHEGFHALLWEQKPDGLWFHVFAKDKPLGGTIPLFVMTLRWPQGESLAAVITRERALQRRVGGVDNEGAVWETEVKSDDAVVGPIRFVLAASLWLEQRILCSTTGPVERHRRKQLVREYDVPPPTDVKVIQLRRTESTSRPPSADGKPVEWSCRWIVNGHWRNQPYKDERKLLYIMPYVKGPEDKPLKVPTHTVYQVSR